MTRERRQFSRVTQPFEVQYRLEGELTASWQSVKSLNLSAGGMRFATPELMELGACLVIRMQLPNLREPLVVRSRVAWSRLLGAGVVENGVEFLEVDSQQQMQIDDLVRFFRKSG